MEVWRGAISNVPDHSSDRLDDIYLRQSLNVDLQSRSLPQSSLQFLAIVDPSWIPLHIIAGQPFHVSLTQQEVKHWFREKLVQQAPLVETNINNKKKKSTTWYEAALPQSSAGILVKVQAEPHLLDSDISAIRITEVVFYATKLCDPTIDGGNHTPLSPHTRLDDERGIILQALPLCSDLFYKSRLYRPPTPPPEGEAFFLSPDSACLSTADAAVSTVPQGSDTTQSINPATDVASTHLNLELGPGLELSASAKKRGHLTDLFEEADERRKKSRHKGGVSVSLAASRKRDTPTKSKVLGQGSPIKANSQTNGVRVKLEDEDDCSFDDGVRVLSVKRRPSGVKAIKGESGPQDQKETISEMAPKRASLSSLPASDARAVQSPFIAKAIESTATFADTSFDTRNKQIVSRTVMACMRLHGLEQRSRPRARSKRSTDTEATDLAGIEPPKDTREPQRTDENNKKEEEDRTNEEYKQVYHQTYKGTLFAFRNPVSTRLLHADEVRTVAHQLLEIFCALST